MLTPWQEGSGVGRIPFNPVRKRSRSKAVSTRSRWEAASTTPELRYARALARANRELRRANRELEEFAYVASHDLREPLRMVNIYTQLLTQECAPGGSEQAQQFARHIHDGVARMERMIQDVLEYSRVAHGPEETPAAPVALRSALDQALTVFGDCLDAAGATVDAGHLPFVLGDETQIAQVFQNLLSNSLKYAHPQRPPQIRIWARETQDQVTVYFSDNGIGFEPEFGERIFGLFKRLHGRGVPGTGLGLAICRRIIERFGGTIRAHGRPANGATFVLSLTRSSGMGKGSPDDDAGCPNPPGRGQSR